MVGRECCGRVVGVQNEKKKREKPKRLSVGGKEGGNSPNNHKRDVIAKGCRVSPIKTIATRGWKKKKQAQWASAGEGLCIVARMVAS